MKKLAITLTLIATLCSANLSHAADRYVSVIVQGKNNSSWTTAVTIGANEVAQIMSYFCTTAISDNVRITKGGLNVTLDTTFSSSSIHGWDLGELPMFIAGPATIDVSDLVSTSKYYFITVKISPNPNINGVGQ